jgi:competence protein ComEA
MIAAVVGGPAGSNEVQAQQRIGADATSNKWEVLEGCRLVDKGARDGDSFHARHRDREYVFRLYFVDAPEIAGTEQAWVEDQASYFGVTPAQVMELGSEASRFTAAQLKGEFTVVTRWENARGMGNLARFYAVVLVDGRNLSAELVRSGLARIHGRLANWPDGPRSGKFMSELKNLELDAHQQRRGAWDDQRFPRPASHSAPATRSETGAKTAGPESGISHAPVDLNEASVGELDSLPGIGKALAERIIAHRPYRTVDDLRKVNGIGDKTFEKLRPHVVVRQQKSGN